MPDPLHPAVVHFPLVLAALLPLAAVPAFLLILRRSLAPRVWLLVSVWALLAAGSAWAAVETGEDQEEVVEEVVRPGAIHEHEEEAEALLFGAGLLAVLSVVGLAGGRAGATARGLTAVGSLVVLVLAVRTGGSGGELVYEHGAASAYLSGAPTRAGGSGERGDRGEDGDGEDGEEHHEGEHHE